VCRISAPSLRFNPMPPRITQQSCRPRVSHRIMVGTLANAFACVVSGVEWRRSHRFMKPPSWDHQPGWPHRCNTRWAKSRQDQNPSRNGAGAGCKSPHQHLPQGRGGDFFLDILSHRTTYRWEQVPSNGVIPPRSGVFAPHFSRKNYTARSSVSSALVQKQTRHHNRPLNLARIYCRCWLPSPSGQLHAMHAGYPTA